MARKFTLAQLMVGLTLLCVVCGILVNLLVPIVGLVLTLVFFAPTLAVILWLSQYYEDRDAWLWRVVVGIVVGFFAGPDVAISPALGALLFLLPPVARRGFRRA